MILASILSNDDISFLYDEYLKAEDINLFVKNTDGKFRVNRSELEMIWQAFDKVSEYNPRKKWWCDAW